MGNRNTINIKIAVENANLCGKNMRHVQFAEICEKRGNKRNMRQSHIQIKLTTCLSVSLAACIDLLIDWYSLLGLTEPEAKRKYIVSLLSSLPEPNKSTMCYIIDHILRSVPRCYIGWSLRWRQSIWVSTFLSVFENQAQKNRDISATVWPIFTKFVTLMQNWRKVQIFNFR